MPGAEKSKGLDVKLSQDQPLAGILEPVFAIRTEEDLGIGDTDGVRQMMDWCHEHGLNIFQTLPINETSDDNCPYNAISSLAIDPATLAISPRFIPDLSRQKFNQIARPDLLRELRRGQVNYAKVKALKRALLQAAFDTFVTRHFNPGTTRAGQFRRFMADNAEWLADYALFRVLMEENGNQPAWDRWPPAHQTPPLARAWLLSLSEKQRGELARQQLFFMYVQWLAFDQWQALKSYGDRKQVCLMGDIPFGVGRCSADVWANRAIFDLDWSGGAPPEKFFKVDAFTEKWGQNWGMPDYRWDELRRRNFDWWRTRVGNIQKAFHLCRIDHAPGFFRIYSFPWTPDRNAEFLPLDETQAAAPDRGQTARIQTISRRHARAQGRQSTARGGNTPRRARSLRRYNHRGRRPGRRARLRAGDPAKAGHSGISHSLILPGTGWPLRRPGAVSASLAGPTGHARSSAFGRRLGGALAKH